MDPLVNGVESQHALCQSLGLYQIGLELGFLVTLLIKCHILHRKKSISFTPLDATLEISYQRDRRLSQRDKGKTSTHNL